MMLGRPGHRSALRVSTTRQGVMGTKLKAVVEVNCAVTV